MDVALFLLFFLFLQFILKESRQDLAHVEKCMIILFFFSILVSGKNVHVHYITKDSFCSYFFGRGVDTKMADGTTI